MHTRAHTVPRWIQRGEPEPYPGAFRDFVARLDEKPCCPVARIELRALRAFLDAPAGLCLRCGGMGAWRRGWTNLDAAYTPVGCTRTHYPHTYYDLCAVCVQAPDAHARAEATLRLRPYAAWN